MIQASKLKCIYSDRHAQVQWYVKETLIKVIFDHWHESHLNYYYYYYTYVKKCSEYRIFKVYKGGG